MMAGNTEKIKIWITVSILFFFAVSATGCADPLFHSPPTLSVPTPNVVIPPTGSAGTVPTKTPDSEQEIHFTDPALEEFVRKELNNKIGPIRRADIEPIRKLEMNVYKIYNIDSLQYFTNLEELYLYGNYITDFSVLEKLPSLKKLNIGRNYNVSNPSSSGNTGLDLSPLKNLVLLEELDISENMLTDLTVIGSLPALQTLTACKNRISDITPLSGCKSLTYVDLSDNFIMNADNTVSGITDLSPLYGNPHLRTLIASNNLIKNIDGIEAMPELSFLDLSSNRLDSVAPLAGVRKLETVRLRENLIPALDSLKDNTTIRSLDVSYNLLSNFDVIRTMPALRNLVWEGNNIQDYAAIDEFEARMAERQNT